MSKLDELAAKRDQILLAEIGALIHDLGKLSKEFVFEPTEAHSHILPRLSVKQDPYAQTQEADKARSFVSQLRYEANRRLATQPYLLNLILALADEVSRVIGTDGWTLDQAHSFLKSEFARDANLQRLAGHLDDYRQRVLTTLTDIPKWEKTFSPLVSGELADVLDASQFQQRLELSGFSTLRQMLRLGDFVALHHQTVVSPTPALVSLLKALDGGVDGFDSWIDKGQVSNDAKQAVSRTFIATAFGHEAQRIPVSADEDGLKPLRYQFANVLAEALSQVRDGKAKPAQVRARIFSAAETAFRQALGETRRAANDVTLWDHSYSVASLYKAALAKVLLEGKWTEPKDIGWRFLRVGVDGLRFFAQAHHVTDILGRRQALMEALDRVRQALEVEYPLGNEVYRDENGSVFVMPGLADEDAHKQLAQEVEEFVRETFRQSGLGEELVPEVTWNDREPVRKEMTTAFGLLVAQELPSPTPDPEAMRDWWEDPQARGKEICTVCGVRPIGYDVPRLYKRRVAYYLEAADERKVCGPCLDRRGKRSQAWVTDAAEFRRTIWTDEVADNNARFALVVGRFDLDGWLDGRLVKTMLVAPNISKNPSPARIRRVWDTTHRFWHSLVEARDGQRPELEKVLGSRPFRLHITPANAAEVNKALGDYHVYDWPLRGGVTLSVVWVPHDKGGGHFLTADNLWYLAGPEQLGLLKREELDDDVRVLTELGGLINRQEKVRLEEPSGYGRPAEVRVIVERPEVKPLCEPYTPYIPILAEPATFMALVPADKALDVARAIKAKYDCEMARVRDRLPLHLGLVFAPRRTPLAAVLDAGRAMLGMPDAWEKWGVVSKEITEKTLDDGRQVPGKATLYLRPASRGINPPAEEPKGAEAPSASRLQPASPSQPDDSSSGDGRAQATWHYPLLMGDGRTRDDWYPHLLLYEPDERLKEKKEQGMVPQGEEPELKKQDGDFAFVSDLTGAVFIRPSRFDFEFLDTTARRFEIAYQTSEASETSEVSRPSRRTRPFLLDDLDRLERLWEDLCQLEKSQRHQVIAAIEATREAWFGDDREGRSLSDGVFRQFVRDTLAGAAWPQGRKWADLSKGIRKQLEDAGVTGELADFAELHMQILKE